MYWEQTAVMRIENKTSTFQDIKRGVRQGCVLSPDLFSLYSEIIIRNLENHPGIKVGGQNINNLRYADDTVLIAENKDDLQKLLNIVEEESRKKGLELNSKRTEVMKNAPDTLDRKENERVLNEANKRRSLVRTIRKRQATFLGHVMRRGKLEHLVTTRKFEGKRSRGRQREKIMDGLATWLGPGKVNYLLPWDISVKSEQVWPSVSETFGSGKKRQQRKLSKAGPEPGDTATTVRVYLGMEYECPRGHRFFCSGPDKIIKVSSNSIVKDNASRLVHMDMPLYTPCHCKQPKGCLAQMMRVFVATPRDIPGVPSLRVLVNPLVQPAPPSSTLSLPSQTASSSSVPSPLSPAGCPQFHPGLDSPLELPPDGLWVIRLPSIYQDEHHVYLMPTDHQQLHHCVLLSGMFTYKIL
ncbi:protein smg8 [Plakobranchus ocellatus]|uniref:Nonsense-mediated mRNA decay factor SMG8 n=1 Tax=Plakobranchus ocellatus TaxID=259542 RepID=A0AAV4B5H2_9GAST|nr:protein smg8 [Plakobranchus ocellatus]